MQFMKPTQASIWLREDELVGLVHLGDVARAA